MGYKVPLLLLAVIGFTMLVIGGYTQWATTDLARFALTEVLARGVQRWAWWEVVGIPVVAAATIIAVSVIGLVQLPRRRAPLWPFVVCCALSVVILPLGGSAVFASGSTALLLALILAQRARSRTVQGGLR